MDRHPISAPGAPAAVMVCTSEPADGPDTTMVAPLPLRPYTT